MAERHDRQSALVAPPAPVKKFIPYGQFTDIDQRYYDPVETPVSYTHLTLPTITE